MIAGMLIAWCIWILLFIVLTIYNIANLPEWAVRYYKVNYAAAFFGLVIFGIVGATIGFFVV